VSGGSGARVKGSGVDGYDGVGGADALRVGEESWVGVLAREVGMYVCMTRIHQSMRHKKKSEANPNKAHQTHRIKND